MKIEQPAWKPGDKIVVSMALTPRLVSGGKSYPECVAVERGPQVLAFDSSLNPGLTSEKALPKAAVGQKVELRDAADKLPTDWKGTQAYTIETAAGPAILVPFADAGQTGATYSVWLGPLPQRPSKKTEH